MGVSYLLLIWPIQRGLFKYFSRSFHEWGMKKLHWDVLRVRLSISGSKFGPDLNFYLFEQVFYENWENCQFMSNCFIFQCFIGIMGNGIRRFFCLQFLVGLINPSRKYIIKSVGYRLSELRKKHFRVSFSTIPIHEMLWSFSICKCTSTFSYIFVLPEKC